MPVTFNEQQSCTGAGAGPRRLSDEEVAHEYAHFRLFGYSRKAIAKKLHVSLERLPAEDAA